MTICLSTFLFESIIDLPRSVSIPDSPMAVRYLEPLLESLTQPPFNWVIDYSDLFVAIRDLQTANGKNGLFCVLTLYLQQIGTASLHFYMAVTENSPFRLGKIFFYVAIAIDVESGGFLKFALLSDGNTQNAWLFARQVQKKCIVVIIDEVNSFKVIPR